ncbi:MAG: cysteine--tRNA ligase [Gammaproteobacteria bacterium]|nr:cysteine--tRNA ligase [Gammaproteobacteria bacterium]
MLQIYNSLTRRKEPFRPIEAGKVRMYVCGMTVYDYCHIGHARVLIAFDVVLRYLRARGFKVTYVRNITDIDDKIIRRAQENGESIQALTARFIDAMRDDSAALGNLPPDFEPRATEFMPRIIAMVESLVAKRYAYVGANNDVYYDVSRFEGYGKLSGKDPQSLRAGARVEVAEAKDDPLDFVLWKAAKADEPAWDSPWGLGRPGWHIECSTMATDKLGAHFDIHGGGMDLQFPHHENEIAQSEAWSGEPFVNYWMHNGFVRVDDEKMSKSLGNFVTVRDVFDCYKNDPRVPEIVRYFIIRSHYRSPLNFSYEQLEGARAALTRWYTALHGLPEVEPEVNTDYELRFDAAMNDDFNVPEARVVLSELANKINVAKREKRLDDAAVLGAGLRKLGAILGLLQNDPDAFLKAKRTLTLDVDAILHSSEKTVTVGVDAVIDFSDEKIDDLMQQRSDARKAKNWVAADRIRKDLEGADIILEDGPEGTTWRRG